MTDTKPVNEPLWDDDRILYWIDDCVYATGDGAQAAHAIASEMRTEYESVLAFDRTRYAEQLAIIRMREAQRKHLLVSVAEQQARIADLNETICKRERLIEKRGEKITEQDTRIAELEQQLREIKQLYAARLVPDEEEMQDGS